MKNLFCMILMPVVFTFALLMGCSATNTPTTPEEETVNAKQLLDENHYQLILDENTGSAELVHRGAQYDVTPYFAIRLISTTWDASLRLLYATIEIESLVDTPFWGARLVFDSTGGRWLINSDGYGYWGPFHAPPIKRMPFIAFERDTYHREITGSDRRELIAYCPPNATNIDLWIDAVRPWERDEPMVEEQFCHKTLAISAWAVTAFCYDYQSHKIRSPKGDINELNVWANLTGVGGSSQEKMYDDGMHFDFAEGDGIYGVAFIPDPMVNFAKIQIYAEDSHGNIGENEVAFIRYFTLRDYPLTTIEKGLWSELVGPHYEIIQDQTRWEQFWALHKGGPAVPPEVNFSKDMVLVAIAGYAGGGHSIEIKRAFKNTKNKLEIQGSTWDGSKGCILPYLLTNAYHFVKMEKVSLALEPKLRNRLFHCDEQLPINVVESGLYSNIHDFRTALVQTQPEWEALWFDHTGGTSEPPVIDFSRNTVAAAFLGDRDYADTYVEFDRVMIYEAPMREIYYSEHYPGAGCILRPLDCQPYEIIVFARDDTVTYEWFYRSVPDDCW